MSGVPRTSRGYAAVCALFLLSGFTALVYQVVWVRLLTLTFGASMFAVAAVLIAFMGGMSIGAFVSGRFVDGRRDQLRLYAVLEIAIGLYALAFPLLIAAIGRFYVLVYQEFSPGFYQISLIRLVAYVLLLLIPTAAMGATLPVLCALLAQDARSASRRTAMLYGINTLGGVLGCVGAGFFLIPYLGLGGTTHLAVALNLAIGVVCLFMQRFWAPSATLPEYDASRPRRHCSARFAATSPTSAPPNHVVAAVIAVTAMSGMTAMVYETIWTRIFSMVVGTTVYAFTTMLAAFLVGIALGSWLYVILPRRQPGVLLALAQAGIGIYVLIILPYCDDLPFAFLEIFAWSNENWSLFQLGRFALLFGVLIIPTTLSGLSFPLAVGIVVHRDGQTGRSVGLLYGFNTIGAIVGAFVGGFILIPFVGLQQGMVMAAAFNLFGALLLFAAVPGVRKASRLTLGTAAVLASLGATLLLSPWELAYINSGAYVYARDYAGVSDLRSALKAYEPLYYREGPTATVGVIRSPRGTLSLTIDGKTDASTGHNADMSTQILLSHLPALFVSQPDEALMIGLGSGVSLGSLLRYRVEHVDVLEISEAVVEASDFFRDYNYNALDDPRVNLIIGDGRHHLERTARTYNLIISQPSNPWITGNANLFTREYYHLLASRLGEGGVACQWIPSYHMSKRMLAVVFKTFHMEFPNMAVWTSSVVGDLFMIGAKGELQLNYALLLERLQRAGIDEDLARIDMNDPKLLGMTFLFDRNGVEGFIRQFGDALPLNTDMHPVVEFSTPRFLLTERVARDLDRRSDLTGDLASLLNLIDFRDEKNRRAFQTGAQAVLKGAVSVGAPGTP